MLLLERSCIFTFLEQRHRRRHRLEDRPLGPSLAGMFLSFIVTPGEAGPGNRPFYVNNHGFVAG